MTAPGQKPRSGPSRRSFLRALGAMPLAVVPLPRPRPLTQGLSGRAPAAAAPATSDPIGALIGQPGAPVRVFMLRGLFVGGYIFSRGLDALAPKLEAQVAGCRASVHWNEELFSLIGEARVAYRDTKAKLVFIGHSAGADSSLYIASAIEPVPVPLIITIDPTRIAPTIPDNVGHLLNIYNSLTLLGGGAFGARRYGSRLEQIDLGNQPVLHIGMDKLPFVQDTIMQRVGQLASR